MARTAKKDITTKTVTTDVNDELMKKFEEMQKQLAQLQAENEALKDIQNNNEIRR